MRLGEIVRVNEPFGAAADQLRGRPAEGGGPGRIDVAKRAIRVGDHQQLVRYVPDAGALARLDLDAPLERRGELAKPRLAGRERSLRALALGDLLGHHVDADDCAPRPPQRVPAGQPEALRVAPVGPLPVDLDAGDRRAGLENRPDDLLDLIGDHRHRFAHRAPDMAVDRDAADFRQSRVDLQIAAVGAQEGEADRRRIVQQAKLGRRVALMTARGRWCCARCGARFSASPRPARALALVRLHVRCP